MKATVTRARYAQKNEEQIADGLTNAECALALLNAGLTIEPARFGLRGRHAADVTKFLRPERKWNWKP